MKTEYHGWTLSLKNARVISFGSVLLLVITILPSHLMMKSQALQYISKAVHGISMFVDSIFCPATSRLSIIRNIKTDMEILTIPSRLELEIVGKNGDNDLFSVEDIVTDDYDLFVMGKNDNYAPVAQLSTRNPGPLNSPI